MSRVWVAPEGAAWADLAARLIERGLDAATNPAGPLLALAGGATPRPVYERLAERARHDGTHRWTRVTLVFGDERAVPFDDAASNLRLAAESLVERLPDGVAAVHPMPVGQPDAWSDYPGAPVDLLLVGMGDDGHILSLFPGSPALDEATRRITWSEAPAEPRRRLTLTPVAVREAGRVLVLVTGGRKAAMVARALTGPHDPKTLPATLVADATWILDEPAAALLPPDVPISRTPDLEDP